MINTMLTPVGIRKFQIYTWHSGWVDRWAIVDRIGSDLLITNSEPTAIETALLINNDKTVGYVYENSKDYSELYKLADEYEVKNGKLLFDIRG